MAGLIAGRSSAYLEVQSSKLGGTNSWIPVQYEESNHWDHPKRSWALKKACLWTPWLDIP